MSYHEKQVCGKSVHWLTPRSILEPLGRFDLDPCGCEGQYPMATRIVMPPADGLAIAWHGRVWLNPPFGQFLLPPWIERLAHHGDGIALVPARIETAWFHDHVWPKASGVFVFRRRIQFSTATFDPKRTICGAGFPSVLIAYGKSNAAAIRAAGFAGKLLILRGRK